jgi:hypothetical protein
VKKMNNLYVLAEINWKKPDFVNRKIKSGVKEYWLNISFENKEDMWSVIMYLEDLKIEKIKLNQSQQVKFGFIAPELIYSFLTEGMKFCLSEGPFALIGEGRIEKILINE